MLGNRKLALNAIAGALVVVGCSSSPGANEGAASTQSASTAAPQTYVVLFSGTQVPNDAGTTIARAGGSLVISYDEIGVAIASSSSATFREDLLAADSRIENATATSAFGIQGGQSVDSSDSVSSSQTVSGGGAGEPLAGLQWDMDQIHAPAARAVTGGSRSVLVGDIDTGVDFDHPDLAPNIDFANSVSCIGGVPDQTPAAWRDDHGHGTHTAGTIAAAANGVGIVGVAPNVRLAAIKAGDSNALFFPEAVICAFMWAGRHHMDITNNSYFADPWQFNCRNDATQRAIWKAEQRAIRYAMAQGVAVVAAEGNSTPAQPQPIDLAHPTVDAISPDYPPDSATTREISNACLIVPVEVSGVIGVTADGNLRQKSFYSFYGQGVTSVVAPGGDSIFQQTAAAPNGRVLSTWPSYIPTARTVSDCSVTPCATYAYQQGTSMASPHVVGVGALILSRSGKMTPGALAAKIQGAADALACPPSPFLDGTPFTATCQGGANNSFYGSGEIDALKAVSN